jgi:hypothetical protein
LSRSLRGTPRTFEIFEKVASGELTLLFSIFERRAFEIPASLARASSVSPALRRACLMRAPRDVVDVRTAEFLNNLPRHGLTLPKCLLTF